MTVETILAYKFFVWTPFALFQIVESLLNISNEYVFIASIELTQTGVVKVDANGVPAHRLLLPRLSLFHVRLHGTLHRTSVSLGSFRADPCDRSVQPVLGRAGREEGRGGRE